MNKHLRIFDKIEMPRHSRGRDEEESITKNFFKTKVMIILNRLATCLAKEVAMRYRQIK